MKDSGGNTFNFAETCRKRRRASETRLITWPQTAALLDLSGLGVEPGIDAVGMPGLRKVPVPTSNCGIINPRDDDPVIPADTLKTVNGGIPLLA